ncbi:spore protein SP21 [bacterium MnTg02]|nr:spore protein SP21 [bacterium MnTg02]
MDLRSIVPSLWGRPAGSPDPFRAMHREMDRLFDEFGQTFRTSAPAARFNGLTPNINVSETDEAIEITVELPGVAEDDIDLTLVDNMLTIRGEKKSEIEEKDKNYHLVERSFGSFERSIALPYELDTDQIKADFQKGVLTVRLPKPPEIEAKTKKIQISSNN